MTEFLYGTTLYGPPYEVVEFPVLKRTAKRVTYQVKPGDPGTGKYEVGLVRFVSTEKLEEAAAKGETSVSPRVTTGYNHDNRNALDRVLYLTREAAEAAIDS